MILSLIPFNVKYHSSFPRSDQFDLDVFQAGAGTSYNINVNEVVANRALELIGKERGDHKTINPNDNVNKSQSTNDMMPTAMRIAALRLLDPLCKAVYDLSSSFEAKEKEFAKISRGRSGHICMTQSPCPSALSLGPTALTSVERRTGFLPKKSLSPKYHWAARQRPPTHKKSGPWGPPLKGEKSALTASSFLPAERH